MRNGSKTEHIVRLLNSGFDYANTAEVLGTTINSVRVIASQQRRKGVRVRYTRPFCKAERMSKR